MCFFEKNRDCFLVSAIPLSLHPKVSRNFLEVRRKVVSATQSLRFFAKIALFLRPSMFDFLAKIRIFGPHCWKIPFFLVASGCVNKNEKTSLVHLDGRWEKKKFLHFLHQKEGGAHNFFCQIFLKTTICFIKVVAKYRLFFFARPPAV